VLDSGVLAMNCHLLIPGLFVPEDAGADSRGELALPALEVLLARGALRSVPAGSLERWLASAFHVAVQHDLPLAALSLRGEGMDPGADCWLRADPVHLVVRGDRVLLAAATGVDVTATEAAELIAGLNSHFAEDGLEFVAPVPHRWYVRVHVEPRIRTTPVAEVSGRSIEGFLPDGDDGPRWRRVMNEAQMLLHGHPVNAAREARGAFAVNSVWFWGAGSVPQVPRDGPYGAIWASHPLAAGIALTANLPLHALPESGARWLANITDRASATHLLVIGDLQDTQHGDSSIWRRALSELDGRWIAPLLQGLARGTLQSLVLHGPGPIRSYASTMTRLDTFRFWRTRRRLPYYMAS
jgi:hypothetical protein